MAEMRRGDAPLRSAARQKLADAIETHREATDAVTKVTEARDRLRTDLSEARSALSKAREAFQDAKAQAPRMLVDALIGEEGTADDPVADIAEAEAVLRDAERRIEHGRQARELLDQELANRQQHLHLAEHDLDTAVQTAVNADPVKQAVLEAFFREGRHVLRLAQIIRTLGLVVTGVNLDECGLGFRLVDQTRPGTGGHASAFVPAGEYSLALSDLRVDADVPLPDLLARPPKE